ncbi:MAG: tyrosine-type recombinase/integrase [Candidatus Acidiferrum sp.]
MPELNKDPLLVEINARLKKGEGWIGYRNIGSGSSKYLYYAFYRDGKQIFLNTKTNDPETAYRQLLASRNLVAEGHRVLPQEASKLKYEDLKQILTDYYREQAPASLYVRKNKLGQPEETFLGADKFDKFFKGLPITQITATRLQDFIKWRRREGDSDATIRRQLGSLRSAFNRAKDLDLITDNLIPSFRLPKDSEPREGFVESDVFEKLRNTLPENLRPTVTFLYYSGQRKGSVKKIVWSMVSANNDEIQMPGRITKNRRPHTVPLVGPLSEIADILIGMRKKFPKPTDRVFDFTNFHWLWNDACDRLGLGKFDRKTRRYEGLIATDFRRAAARNLTKAGVDRRTAMRITGHRTESIFERYNIKDDKDVKEALIKVGQYKKPAVVAEISATR